MTIDSQPQTPSSSPLSGGEPASSSFILEDIPSPSIGEGEGEVEINNLTIQQFNNQEALDSEITTITDETDNVDNNLTIEQFNSSAFKSLKIE